MIDEAVAAIRERSPLVPRVAVVLGSGLGGVAERVEDAVEIPYREIPGWPVSTALGHAGMLVLGTFGGGQVDAAEHCPVSGLGCAQVTQPAGPQLAPPPTGV